MTQRLENFELGHHALNRDSFHGKLDWWNSELNNGHRCRICWLRPKDCFCVNLNSMRAELASATYIDPSIRDIKVCIYYHYQELGRSANTAHLFEAISPAANCESITFGDVENETKLIQDIVSENASGQLMTCILYPHKTVSACCISVGTPLIDLIMSPRLHPLGTGYNPDHRLTATKRFVW